MFTADNMHFSAVSTNTDAVRHCAVLTFFVGKVVDIVNPRAQEDKYKGHGKLSIYKCIMSPLINKTWLFESIHSRGD